MSARNYCGAAKALKELESTPPGTDVVLIALPGTYELSLHSRGIVFAVLYEWTKTAIWSAVQGQITDKSKIVTSP